MEKIDEESFGSVSFRRVSEGIRVLVVKHVGGFWGLPKGHSDFLESPEETAMRETFEETGIVIKAKSQSVLTETYSYQNNGVNRYKRVTYFLSEYVSGEIGLFDTNEIEQCLWVSFKEAEELFKFESSKKILSAAYELIISNELTDNSEVC